MLTKFINKILITAFVAAQILSAQNVTLKELKPALESWLEPIPEIDMPPQVQVYFNPRDDIESEIIRLIEEAKIEILFSQLVVTSPRIANAISNKFKTTQVMICGILESNPGVKGYNSPQFFSMNGIPVLLSNTDGFNNHKYLVIDKQIVATGSYDWTRRAATKNQENLIVIKDRGIASKYYNEWIEQSNKCVIPQEFLDKFKSKILQKRIR